MSLEKVLNNWKDYDEKKIENGGDPNLFSCNESWEIYYLKTKIRNEYPHYDDLKIFEAIEAISRTDHSRRNDFVQLVLKRLGLI